VELAVPDGIELMTDVSPARWIEDRLATWPEGPGFPVRGVVPEGFEAYARILHPTRRAENDVGIGSWAQLARERGKHVHPTVAFESLVGGRGPEEVPDWDDLVPAEELPERECRVLADLVRHYTRTPDLCWFALWEGYGSLVGGVATLRADAPCRRRRIRQARRVARRREQAVAAIPRVKTLRSGGEGLPARTYLLFRGPLDAVTTFRFGVEWQPPNLWWPDDRAWIVATEVDGYDSYVGGSRACVGEIVGSDRLETHVANLDQRCDRDSDDVNGSPWRAS
jgi:hypothetical protein